jgi:nucleotide-binding universal stress UspA family protein
MFKKILWATDGSEAADGALPVVQELAADHGAEVVVCHSTLAAVGPGSHGAPPIRADEAELKAKITAQADELNRAGISANLRLVGGDDVHGAAHAIVHVADEEHVDLIVAGTRGHTLIGGLLLGSVTQRLLHLAHCPVLVVPVRRSAGADDEVRAEQTVA